MNRKRRPFPTLWPLLIALVCSVPFAQADESSQRGFRELQRYAAGEAHQGVAVDEASFYAISSREIAGYQKSDGTPQSRTRQALKHQVTGFFKS